MWMRMRLADVRVMSHYVGLFVAGIGFVMLVPFVTAILFGEWDAALDFLLATGVSFTVGGALALAYEHNEHVTHGNALVLTALGWLAASAAAAIPLAFSANYPTFLDAMFDTVSGLTTSGLTVAVDLDHMAYSMNMWRHLTHLLGGQGIIVAALSLSIGLRGGAFSLYVAEGRDERILPNVLHTARFIWFVTAVYVSIGTIVLFVVNLWRGMGPARGVLHAFWLSIAAYDTGGFGPQSMNAMYYHSFVLEIVLLFLMIAGTMNFHLHAQVWRGDSRELWKNLEVRVLAINALVLITIVTVGLAAARLYGGVLPVVRKGAFHVISAHTGTGHQTVYTVQWIRDLGGTAFAAVLLAMAAGGAVSSTAGGIKALRIGAIIKAVMLQVKQSIAPRTAVISAPYHHLKERLLTPEIAGAAATVFVLYLVTYITGALIGAAYGYGAAESLFESISATANVGLSTGITNAAMPVGLKITYMVQMWAGRLEFVAVLALFAQIVLALRLRIRKAVS